MKPGYYATAAESETQRRAVPRTIRSGRRATHVLVERYISDGLRHLSHVTRVTQAQYLREAVRDLLKKHAHRIVPVVDYHREADDELVSVVFRVHSEDMAELIDLADRTRVRQSEYLREAIVDLLRKHGCPVSKSLPSLPTAGGGR